MKLALSGTLEGLVAAKAARLGISTQDALRMLAVQWVQDEPLQVPPRAPCGTRAVPGETYKEGEADSTPGTIEQIEQKQPRKAKKLSPKISSVPPNTPPEFLPIVTEWLEYKSSRRQGYTALGASKILKYLQELGPARARAAVDFSIRNRYDGLFEPSRNGGGSRASPNATRERLVANEEHAQQIREREEAIEEWIPPELR